MIICAETAFAWRWLSGPLAIAVLIAFLIVGYRLYAPLRLVMASYAMLSYMHVGMTCTRQLLETSVRDAGRNMHPQHYDIVFENVSFSYVDRDILHDIIQNSVPSASFDRRLYKHNEHNMFLDKAITSHPEKIFAMPSFIRYTKK